MDRPRRPGERDAFGPISTDGRAIVLDRAPRLGAPRSILLVPTRGGVPRVVVRVPGRTAQQPNWAPDSGRIAFASNLDGGGDTEIYVAHVDGSEIRRLTDDEFPDVGGTSSPDGTAVSYTSCRGGGDGAPPNCDTFVVDLRTGEQRALTTSPPWEIQADWQPVR